MSSQYYVTPFLNSLFQHETGKFLAHTYTRQPTTPLPGDQVDDWGQPLESLPQPPVTMQPCFYAVEHGPIVTPAGIIAQNLPLLTIPFDDPLQEGDYVQDIMTRGDPSKGIPAVMLLTGPVEVEAINDRAPGYGGVIMRQASLREIHAIIPG